jgi:hypothetical protein
VLVDPGEGVNRYELDSSRETRIGRLITLERKEREKRWSVLAMVDQSVWRGLNLGFKVLS